LQRVSILTKKLRGIHECSIVAKITKESLYLPSYDCVTTTSDAVRED
jgi:hypothetical protein